MNENATIADIFDRSIPEPNSGCWIWLLWINPQGYGAVALGNKTFKAHRVSYELATGVRPPEGLDVCHRCDVRCCVNPDHLFLGSRKDNMADCISKGRFSFTGRGEENPQSKLTPDEVAKIKHALDRGVSMAALGREYNVTKQCICHIRDGLTWSHVR